MFWRAPLFLSSASYLTHRTNSISVCFIAKSTVGYPAQEDEITTIREKERSMYSKGAKLYKSLRQHGILILSQQDQMSPSLTLTLPAGSDGRDIVSPLSYVPRYPGNRTHQLPSTLGNWSLCSLHQTPKLRAATQHPHDSPHTYLLSTASH